MRQGTTIEMGSQQSGAWGLVLCQKKSWQRAIQTYTNLLQHSVLQGFFEMDRKLYLLQPWQQDGGCVENAPSRVANIIFTCSTRAETGVRRPAVAMNTMGHYSDRNLGVLKISFGY